MRFALAALAGTLVIACSNDGASRDTIQPGNESVEPVGASARRGGPATNTGTPPPGSVLRGQVSDLSADVSGLQTRMSDMGLVIDLPADTLFEFDQATLNSAAEAELRKVAEVIRASPPGEVRIVGHTDAKGDEDYNLNLSRARAQTVRDWLGQQVGVRQRRFEVTGRGESAPVAPNTLADGEDDPAGRAKNRRVEVVVPAPARG